MAHSSAWHPRRPEPGRRRPLQVITPTEWCAVDVRRVRTPTSGRRHRRHNTECLASAVNSRRSGEPASWGGGCSGVDRMLLSVAVALRLTFVVLYPGPAAWQPAPP